ncbi:LppA family lipoprotein [Nocardia abscessus]|uniref:LppA family lipoprotein n=1 Tax=Nocardia abscessus TaxID=120957 RepID=UPI0024579F51|nr:LppA family lipoprotein [Nocardia abscessus]
MSTTFKRITLAATIIAVVLAIVGVLAMGYRLMNSGDPYEATSEQDTERATQQLLSRPSIEDVEPRVQAIVEQIGAAAAELVPGMHWKWNRDSELLSCDRPFDQTSGRKVHLRLLYSGTPIPDEIWPRFFERARALAATLGATTQQTVHNGPSTGVGRDVNFYNPEDGTAIRIGSQRATVISGIVGCHLPRADFGSPIPPTS